MEVIAQLPPPTKPKDAAPAPDCCSNCVFFLPHGPMGGIDPANLKAPARGYCRRFPPTVQITGQVANQLDPKAPPQAVTGRAMVPVIGSEWCGEYQPVTSRYAESQ